MAEPAGILFHASLSGLLSSRVREFHQHYRIPVRWDVPECGLIDVDDMPRLYPGVNSRYRFVTHGGSPLLLN